MSDKLRLFFSARLVEAGDVSAEFPEGVKWRVQIIDAGVSANGNDYPLGVLHEAAPLFEGAKVLSRSDESHVKNRDVDVANAVGWLEDVRPNAEGLEGTVVFHGGGKSGEIREGVLAAWKLGKKDLAGLSIVADGIASKVRRVRGIMNRVVEKIVKVASVDIVVNPAAGGRFKQLIAGVDPNEKDGSLMNLDKLLKLIEAHAPEEYKKIDLDDIDEAFVVETAGKITEALAEKVSLAEAKLAEALKPPKTDPKTEPTAGLSELRETVSTLTKTIEELRETMPIGGGVAEELAAMKFETLFESMLAGSRLPDDAREHILHRIPTADRRVDKKEKLAEAIAAEERYYFKRQGFEGVPSIFAESIVDEGEKFVASLTGLLTGKDEPYNQKDPKSTVPRIGSLREAYIHFTGDNTFSGIMPRNGRGISRLYEADLNAQWAYVLGDSITRAMMKEYKEYPLQAWRKIVDIGRANDFRTQHRTQLGGFSTLATVTAGNDYAEFTTVPDDFEATFAVSKKGNIQYVTLEMIMNDDVGRVKRLPKNIARAALRTLDSAVWTPITSNAALVLSGDTNNLFDLANHANTTASFEAMSLDAITAGRVAMMKQTHTTGGERTNIGPRYVAAAVDLEDTMFYLLYANGKPVLDQSTAAAVESETQGNFLRRLGLEPITIPTLTDTNDWFLIADPEDIPTIEVAFLGGREEPEIFVSDMQNVGEMFVSDRLTYKVRHVYGVSVNDYRGFYGQLN